MLVLLLAVFIALTASVLAYDGYGYFGTTGFPSVSELAQNEWVNAALLFLLIFAFCWFVMQKVFAAQKGAGIIISAIMGIIGALGVIYFYGPIISRFGHWLLILILVATAILLFIQFRAQGNVLFFILLALSFLWLFSGHRMLCPPLGALFPHELCILLDTIAAILIIIGIIKLLAWILSRIRGHITIGGGGGGGGENYCVLTIGVQGNGTTNPAPGNYRRRINSRVTVRAIPGKNARLDHWELDGINLGANPRLTVLMNTDHTLYAIFTGVAPPPEKVNVNISIMGPGKTTPGIGTHTYPKGAVVPLAAFPEKNSKFKEWHIQYVRGTCKSRSFNLNLRSPAFAGKNSIKVIAVFEDERPPRGISVHIEAHPSRIGQGQTTTIKWSSKNADWVEINPMIPGKRPQGSQKVVLNNSTTFTAIAVNREGEKATASCHVEVMKALPPAKTKALPPPAEINVIKRDLIRVQQLLDREMKRGVKANRARIDNLLAKRDQLMKKLHELRR